MDIQQILNLYKIIFMYTYNMTRLGNEENESFEISTIELLPKFLQANIKINVKSFTYLDKAGI